MFVWFALMNFFELSEFVLRWSKNWTEFHYSVEGEEENQTCGIISSLVNNKQIWKCVKENKEKIRNIKFIFYFSSRERIAATKSSPYSSLPQNFCWKSRSNLKNTSRLGNIVFALCIDICCAKSFVPYFN